MKSLNDYAVNQISKATGIPKQFVNATLNKAAGYAADYMSTPIRSGSKRKNSVSHGRSKIRISDIPNVKIPMARRKAKGVNGRYAGSFKKPKRSGKSVFDKYARTGYTLSVETGGYQGGNKVAYLGHATFPVARAVEMTSYAIMKKLYQGAGLHFSYWTDEMKKEYRLLIRFQLNDNTGTEGEITYDRAVTSSWSDLAFDLLSWFTAKYRDRTSTDYQYLVHSFELQQRVGTTTDFVTVSTVQAEAMQVHFYCKSQLKVQNQTTESADHDADDVDNVPLVGRHYTATGTGFRLVRKLKTSTQALIANTVDGHFTAANGAVDGIENGPYAEPPLNSMLSGRVKSTQVRLAPGKIRASTISGKVSLKLQVLLQDSGWDSDPGAVARPYLSKGKTAMLALEKVLDVNVDQNILCAYEYQADYGCEVKVKKPVTLRAYRTNLVP